MNNENKYLKKVTDRLYCISTQKPDAYLRKNSYLILPEDKNGKVPIILDTGSVGDFHLAMEAIQEICDIESLAAMVLCSSSPDTVEILNLWHNSGFRGQVYADWRVAMLLSDSELLLSVKQINERNKSAVERLLDLEFAHLLHSGFPGYFLVYWPYGKVLFSGNFFSSMGGDVPFYNDDSIKMRISIFNSQINSPALGEEVFLWLRDKPINLICPRYGSIIADNIPFYVDNVFSAEEKENYKESEYRLSKQQRNEELARATFELQERIILSSDARLRDSLTGLYTGEYFSKFLPVFISSNTKGWLSYFRLDGMKSFNERHDFAEGDRAISTFAKLIMENKPEESMLFRESGPSVLMLTPDSFSSSIDALHLSMQKLVRDSEDFIENVTCSIAAVGLNEIQDVSIKPAEEAIKLLRGRIKVMDEIGDGAICAKGLNREIESGKQIIILIEPDPVAARFLVDFFTPRNITTVVCGDGNEAIRLIDIHRPRLVISELHVPQLDGFRIRQRLLETADLKDIEFILLSRQRNESEVLRAYRLGILHFLRKPFNLAELGGLVKVLMEEKNDH